jgi:hypothetical protein
MTPEQYIRTIIEQYHIARLPVFYSPNIKRGRSASISAELEDLTALFIALNNPVQCLYHTDQPVSLKIDGKSKTYYPDVLIVDSNHIIKDMVDVKTDIGWQRTTLFEFCEMWDKNIESLKGKDITYKEGKTKSDLTAKFSNDLIYHVLIVSKENSNNKIDEQYYRVLNELKNVKLYVLTEKLHPNNYDFANPEDTLSKMKINHHEFDRFMSIIINSVEPT